MNISVPSVSNWIPTLLGVMSIACMNNGEKLNDEHLMIVIESAATVDATDVDPKSQDILVWEAVLDQHIEPLSHGKAQIHIVDPQPIRLGNGSMLSGNDNFVFSGFILPSQAVIQKISKDALDDMYRRDTETSSIPGSLASKLPIQLLEEDQAFILGVGHRSNTFLCSRADCERIPYTYGIVKMSRPGFSQDGTYAAVTVKAIQANYFLSTTAHQTHWDLAFQKVNHEWILLQQTVESANTEFGCMFRAPVCGEALRYICMNEMDETGRPVATPCRQDTIERYLDSTNEPRQPCNAEFFP